MVIYYFRSMPTANTKCENWAGCQCILQTVVCIHQLINNIFFIYQKNQIVPMNIIMKWEINHKQFVFAASLREVAKKKFFT